MINKKKIKINNQAAHNLGQLSSVHVPRCINSKNIYQYDEGLKLIYCARKIPILVSITSFNSSNNNSWLRVVYDFNNNTLGYTKGQNLPFILD